jgi:hypothetical protein
MWVFIPLLLVASMFVGKADAGENLQLWVDMDAGGILTEKVSAHTKQALRWRNDDAKRLTYFADFGIKHATASWLSLGLFYRQQFDESSLDNSWLEENRTYADASIKWTWKGVHFSDRHRIEYRVREGREDEFRFRNKLTELFPKTVTRLKLRPYMAQELFFDEGSNELTESSRVRMFLGFRGDPEDHVRFLAKRPKDGRTFKSDWYIIYDLNEKGDDWENTVVIGLKFGVFF